MNPELTVTRLGGFERGKKTVHTSLPVTIGADPGCDIRFDPTWDKTVSPRHCAVFHNAGQWWVEDSGSREGTFLNSQKVTRSPLPPGSVLYLGKDGPGVRLEYALPAMTMPQPQAPQPQQPPYASPAPAPYPAPSPATPTSTGVKPGKLTTIAVLTLISGILNALGAVGWIFAGLSIFLVGIVFTIIPAAYLATLAVFEIIYASKILSDPIRATKPATHVAIMEIVSIITGNVFSLIVGILAMVFYGDPAVKAYFARSAQQQPPA